MKTFHNVAQTLLKRIVKGTTKIDKFHFNNYAVARATVEKRQQKYNNKKIDVKFFHANRVKNNKTPRKAPRSL